MDDTTEPFTGHGRELVRTMEALRDIMGLPTANSTTTRCTPSKPAAADTSTTPPTTHTEIDSAINMDTHKNMHLNPALCHILVRSVGPSFELAILPSRIPGCETGLFANEDIPAYQEIFRSTPHVAVADPRQKACDYCAARQDSLVAHDGKHNSATCRIRDETEPKSTFSRCSACKVTLYCSKRCQSKAWKTHHKLECARLAANPSQLLVARAAWYMARCQWIQTYKPNITSLSFSYLPSNREKFLAFPRVVDKLHSLAIELAKDCVGLDLVTGDKLDWMTRVFERFQLVLLTNGDAFYSSEALPDRGPLGICLDWMSAIINHSCDPNVVCFYEDRQLRYRSLKPIKKGDEIVKSYLSPASASGEPHRRVALSFGTFIRCHCSRCESERAEGPIDCFFSRRISFYADRLRRILASMGRTEFVSHWEGLTSTNGHDVAILDHHPAALLRVENKCDALLTAVTVGGLPRNLEPLPEVWHCLSVIHRDRGDLVTAVRLATRAALQTCREHGSLWLMRTCALLRVVRELLGEMEGKEQGRHADFTDLSAAELRVISWAYLAVVCREMTRMYGGDTRFTAALRNWLAAAKDSGDQELELDLSVFVSSQVKLLKWAWTPMEYAIRL